MRKYIKYISKSSTVTKHISNSEGVMYDRKGMVLYQNKYIKKNISLQGFGIKKKYFIHYSTEQIFQ